ncbi:MAG: hypothetical protein DCE90_14025 [Pseudanabaena sp.]|nr:MAG: hypothetical protein DCE90_14025 [Pseudanabaena sp.]
MTIKTAWISSGTSQAIELALDQDKYDTALAAACGVSFTAPAAGVQKYPYKSQSAALATGAIIRAKLKVKLGKKTRTITVIADKDKADTLAADLVGQKIKVGGSTKVDWDVTKVTQG